jgi:hypothetical protein
MQRSIATRHALANAISRTATLGTLIAVASVAGAPGAIAGPSNSLDTMPNVPSASGVLAPPVLLAQRTSPSDCAYADFGVKTIIAQPNLASICQGALAQGRAILVTWDVGPCPQRVCRPPDAYVPFDGARPFYGPLPADARATLIAKTDIGAHRCFALRAAVSLASPVYSDASNVACPGESQPYRTPRRNPLALPSRPLPGPTIKPN